MSGLAVLFTRGPRPALPRLVDGMLDVMACRGPDDRGAWHEGPVALGHLAFHTTPEDRPLRQPHVAPGAPFVVVLDGRLDNRDDLGASLSTGSTLGDAALVAAAYERWGDACCERLIGDFALAIWDRRQHRLLCARDVMGTRPLFYAEGRQGELLIASEPRALLSTGLVASDVDDAILLEHLVGQGLSLTGTPHAHIRRLAPAHTLVVTGGVCSTRRYWHFEPAPRIRYRRATDYADHLRALLMTVVRAQARACGRPAVMLSGGVDSAVVSALAAAADVGDAVTLDGRGTPYDETTHAAAVCRALGLRHQLVPVEEPAAGWCRDQVAAYRDFPEPPNSIIFAPLRRRAAARGHRVLLTGIGGDEWLTGSSYHHADWLRRGRVDKVVRQAIADVRHRGVRLALTDVSLTGVWPLLPRPVRTMVKRVAGRRPSLPDVVDPDAARRHGLPDRVASRVEPRPGETFAQAESRLLGAHGYVAHVADLEDRAAARDGVEFRHPLNDRRVIDFALAIPEDVRWRGGWRKWVLREMVRGRIPEAVRTRRDKAEYSTAFLRAAVPWQTGAGFPRLAARGLIREDAANRLTANLLAWGRAGDPRLWSVVWPCWTLFAAEYWLEHEQTRSHDESKELSGRGR